VTDLTPDELTRALRVLVNDELLTKEAAWDILEKKTRETSVEQALADAAEWQSPPQMSAEPMGEHNWQIQGLHPYERGDRVLAELIGQQGKELRAWIDQQADALREAIDVTRSELEAAQEEQGKTNEDFGARFFRTTEQLNGAITQLGLLAGRVNQLDAKLTQWGKNHARSLDKVQSESEQRDSELRQAINGVREKVDSLNTITAHRHVNLSQSMAELKDRANANATLREKLEHDMERVQDYCLKLCGYLVRRAEAEDLDPTDIPDLPW
jgi:uncharacterized phage infection (PIP) family protein YhgE